MKALKWIWAILFFWAVLGVIADSLGAQTWQPPRFRSINAADLPAETVVVHIKTIHFDLARCILFFTAEMGEPDSAGKVHRKKKAKFAIDLDNGKMTKNGAHPLPLSEREAQTMDAVFDQLLRQYSFQSVVWYEEGGQYPALGPADSKGRAANGKLE